MEMNYRLIITDLDGTLTPHGMGKDLSERTKETIRCLARHGVSFGLASGRPLDELHAYAARWDLEKEVDVLVGLNGSELWDGHTGRSRRYFMMKREWLKEVIEKLEPFDLNPYVYYHGTFLCKRIDEGVLRSSGRADKPAVAAKDISELYAEENAKIMFRVREEQMAQVEKFMEENPSPYYRGFKTQKTLFEVSHRQVSKIYAISKYCEEAGFSPEQVIAFGDTSNDNEMLAGCGLGVCVANASEDTKAIADEITALPCDQEGVASYMEERFLKPLGWI